MRAVPRRALSEDDVAEAQAYIAAAPGAAWSATIDQAQRSLQGIALGYYQPLDAYLAKIDAVTAADVQRAAQVYLDPEQYTLVVVGP